MATAGELQIVLSARDDASAQLRQVGQDVQRLEQQVSAVGRGFGGAGGGLTAGITTATGALRGLGAVAQTIGGGLALGVTAASAAFVALHAAAEVAGRAVGAVAAQFQAGFGANTELERATIAFRRFTGSAEAATDIIATLRREAAVSPFNDQEIIGAGRALVASAQGSTEALLQLVRVAEQLATLDPVQGLTGGVVALQEALSGDFTSLIRRFEIPRQMIERLKAEGVPNLEIVKRALEFRGVDASSIEAYGRSFEGLQSTIVSFGQELRQLATAGAFQAIGQAFGHLVALINRYGDELRAAAQAIGQLFLQLGQRVVQGLAPVLSVLDQLLPGVGQAIRDEFATPIAQAGEAAERTGTQLQALQAATDLQRVTRALADVGVQAATIQIDADRVRRAYEDQLRPLERQRELLQHNAQLLGVQNALAANRATAERSRLQLEIGALQRVAGAATDPAAADLTPRQRAIALALQERQLRVEELDLTEQQRPALQTIDQQIQSIQRAQADALAPLERSLELRREEASLLQIERERLQQAVEDAQAAAAALGETWKAAGGPDATAQAENKKTIGQRADELAKEWLDRFEAWVNENGGNAWTAIGKSLTQWALETGIPLAVRIGAQIAAGIYAGMVAAWDRLLAQNPLLQALVRGIPGGGLLLPETRATVANDTPVRDLATTVARTVTVNVGGVQVDGQADPSLEERLKQALVDAIQALILTGLTTEPGAGAQLQGAGRAP